MKLTIRAMCAIPFFDPIEAEFEKIVFIKIVALAILYLVVFENSKKSSFLSFLWKISVGWSTERIGWSPDIFRDQILEVYFSILIFFSMDFRCSWGV